MINKLSKEIHQNNISKGFYEKKKNIGEMLCLIHSEVSEALECDRKNRYCKSTNLPKKSDLGENAKVPFEEHWKSAYQNKVKDTFEDELADAMIRIMDLAAYMEIDLEKHIRLKMKYNSLRPFKHGEKY